MNPVPKPPVVVKEKHQTLVRKTPIAKINPTRITKRRKLQAKQRRSPDELAARAAARVRAGGRCEFIIKNYDGTFDLCFTTEDLQDHHKSHPKGVKITADHFAVYCTPHHHYVEMRDFPHRAPRRKAVGS